MKKSTGKVISGLRKHCRLTQKELAEKMHITVATLANIERGRVGLDLEKLCMLSKIFSASADTILSLILLDVRLKDDRFLEDFLKNVLPATSLKKNELLLEVFP